MALESLATIALAHGEAEETATLLASAARIREQLGSPRSPGDRAGVESVLAGTRSVLSAQSFRAATAAGSDLPLEMAVDQALALAAQLAARETPRIPATPAADMAPRFGLSAREQEVLRLLVEGRTNPEIARALAISQKTVRNHVTNILTKLDVESRTAAATFALRQGIV
jgi:DNA-binding NarL/FixJ family response regulator